VSRRARGKMSYAYEFQQLRRAPGNRRFFVARRTMAQYRTKHPLMRAHVSTNHHIFDCAHVSEQTDILKRARDAGTGDFMRSAMRVGFAVEFEASCVRLIQAGDHVEHRGFASTIGPDQPIDLSTHDAQVHIVQGLQAAEAFRCT
jgi:hypothetical protein